MLRNCSTMPNVNTYFPVTGQQPTYNG